MRRQEIIDAILERMVGLGHVFDWRMSTIHDEELPVIVVRDTEAHAEDQIRCKTNHTLLVTIEIIDAPFQETMREMRQKVVKVIERFMDNDGKYPLLEKDRRYISSRVSAENQEKYITHAAVDFEINYITNINEI